MTDNNERTGWSFGGFRYRRCGLFDFSGLIILGHRFKPAQEIPPLGRNLPSLGIAKHKTAAENIDGWNPAGETLEACAPVSTACGEDNDVASERSKRGSTVAVTSQYLQNSNLYAQANAFGPQRFLLFCAVVGIRILRCGGSRPATAASYPQA
jgi:nitroreductase